MLVLSYAREKEKQTRRRARKIGSEETLEARTEGGANRTREESWKGPMGQAHEGGAWRTCGTWRAGFAWQI